MEQHHSSLTNFVIKANEELMELSKQKKKKHLPFQILLVITQHKALFATRLEPSIEIIAVVISCK